MYKLSVNYKVDQIRPILWAIIRPIYKNPRKKPYKLSINYKGDNFRYIFRAIVRLLYQKT